MKNIDFHLSSLLNVNLLPSICNVSFFPCGHRQTVVLLGKLKVATLLTIELLHVTGHRTCDHRFVSLLFLVNP